MIAEQSIFLMVAILVAVGLMTVIGLLSRYKKCKSDEILVIYGKTGKGGKSAKIIHGGGAFVWPIIQGYEFMSLKPMQIDCNLQDALSAQKIRVTVPTTITVAISTEPDVRQAAAERLLGVGQEDKIDLIKDLVYGQMRLVIADMTIEELNNDRDKFIDAVRKNIDEELKKFGLYLMNINIADIRDGANYIVNLGKEAESRAKNEAEANIAEQEKLGAIRVAEQKKERETVIANTERERETVIAETKRDKEVSIARTETERRTQIAETERERETAVAKAKSEQDSAVAAAEAERESNIAKANASKEANVAKAESDRAIKVAEAKKAASLGENTAAEAVAESEARLKVAQAQARREAGEASAIADAKIEETKQLRQAEVETARAEKVRRAQEAEVIVPTEIAKRKVELEAEAKAEAARRAAAGEADAILAKAKAEAEAIRIKKLAEAEGKEADLLAEAQGFAKMLEAANSNPTVAIQYKMVEQWKGIAEEYGKAVQSLKVGDVKIYDNGSGKGLSNFLSGTVTGLAPIFDQLRSMPLPTGVQKWLDDTTPTPDGPNGGVNVAVPEPTRVINESATKQEVAAPQPVKFPDVETSVNEVRTDEAPTVTEDLKSTMKSTEEIVKEHTELTRKRRWKGGQPQN